LEDLPTSSGGPDCEIGKKVFKISYFYGDFRSLGIVGPIVIHIFGRLTPLFEGFVWNFDESKPALKTG